MKISFRPPSPTPLRKKKKKERRKIQLLLPPPSSTYPSRPKQRQHFLHRRRRAFALPGGVHLEGPEPGLRHQLQSRLEGEPHLRLGRDPRLQPLHLVEVEDERAEDGVGVGQSLGELGGARAGDVRVAKDRDGEPRPAAAGVGGGELVEARVEGLEAGDEDEGAPAVGERADIARGRRGRGRRRGRRGRRRRGRRGRDLGRRRRSRVVLVAPPPAGRRSLPRPRPLERALERRPLGLDARPRGLERRRLGLERGPGENGGGGGRRWNSGGSCFLGLGGEQGPRRGRVGAAEGEKVGLGEPRGGREPLGSLSSSVLSIIDDFLVGQASEGGGVGVVELGLEVGGLRRGVGERERVGGVKKKERGEKTKHCSSEGTSSRPYPIISSPALSAWRAARRCRHQRLRPPRAARAPRRASPPRRPGSMTTERRRRRHVVVAADDRRRGLEKKKAGSRRWRPCGWNPHAEEHARGPARPHDGAGGAPALEPRGSAR